MKKLLSILIAIALILSLSVTAFAEETGNLSITRGGVTEYFDYIVEAFEAAEDGDVIKVERDYTEEYGINCYCEDEPIKSVTFDLNGKEIHFPEQGLAFEDHGMMDIVSASVTFIDTVGGGIFHAIVSPYENVVVKGGTYRGFWPAETVTIEGGTFLGLPQEIVDQVWLWDATEKSLIGTKGLLLTDYDRVFLTEDEAREALDAIIADGYVANKPYDITPYEKNGETRYSAGFTAGTSIVKKDSNTTTVTYEVAPTYTVTIPATVALGETATIKAENVVVAKGKQVEVALTDANGFTVATPQGAELGYTVKNGETIVNEGDTVLTVNPDNGKTGETTITFTTPETALFAGDYTGTVAFTIAVKDVSKTIINFTVDTISIAQWTPGLTANLQAEAGMTWGEWVESAYNVDGYIVYQLHWIDVDVVGPNATWAISRDRQNYDSYVSLTDEIIAGYEYCFEITGG